MPRLLNTPSRNTVVIGGAIAAAILLMASKILVNFPPCVDQSIAIIIITTAAIRPITTCPLSVVEGLSRFTISTETSVAELLSAAAKTLIRAANNAADTYLSNQ